jgi:hypothetical protein
MSSLKISKSRSKGVFSSALNVVNSQPGAAPGVKCVLPSFFIAFPKIKKTGFLRQGSVKLNQKTIFISKKPTFE